MRSETGVLLATVVALLVGLIVGLIAGILAWILASHTTLTQRAAGAVLRAGAACAAGILLTLAIFAAVGILR